MKSLLTALLFVVFTKMNAQVQNINRGLSADSIPESLTHSADAVIRQEITTIEIKKINEVIYNYRKVITIFNTHGNHLAALHVNYDASSEVKNLQVKIYDGNGILLNKLNQTQIEDYHAADGFSFFLDQRVKVFTPELKKFPYTVEYTFEVKEKNTLAFPTWYPQDTERTAVQKSEFRIICFNDFKIRTNEKNFKGIKNSWEYKDFTLHQWSVADLKAFQVYPYIPPPETMLPYVMVAPVHFHYEGQQGYFTDWQEYGVWTFENLLKGRDVLPEETAEKIKELTHNASTLPEKIKIVYEYVQQKTRYVSIQKGIGGLRPMTAAEVDQLGYSDCKGLTNYTMALLKSIGIPSIYTEIYAGEQGRNIIADFTSLQGNHAILCVPLSKDTIWLECTSKTNPFGYLGTFTDNRTALLCKPEGSVIATTKKYSSEMNKVKLYGIYEMDTLGGVKGILTENHSGIFYDQRPLLSHLSGQKKTDRILEAYSINGMEIEKHQIEQTKSGNPETSVLLHFRVPSYGYRKNNKIIFKLHPVSEKELMPENSKETDRKLFIRNGFVKEMITEWMVPENFTIEDIPANKFIVTKIATYTLKFEKEGNKLVVRQAWKLNEGKYQDAYRDLIHMCQQINSGNKMKLVFSKNG